MEDGVNTLGFSYKDIEDINTNFTFEKWHKAAKCYAKALSNGRNKLERYKTKKMSIAEKNYIGFFTIWRGILGIH